MLNKHNYLLIKKKLHRGSFFKRVICLIYLFIRQAFKSIDFALNDTHDIQA